MIPFRDAAEIDAMPDLGPTVGIASYIGDVRHGLTRLGLDLPKHVDYPEELQHLLGREIRRGTLGDVRRGGQVRFIKPVAHKLFTGFVYAGDAESRRRVVTLDDDVEIWVTDPLEITCEYRAFILDGEILDCRRYSGDWGKAPDRATVESALPVIKQRAACLDWAVLNDGRTILVEKNDGYSMGHYGLAPALYARMLSARWHELTTRSEAK